MIHENLLPAHRIARRKLHRCINAWVMALGILGVLTGGLIVGANITKARPPAMPAGLTQDIELGRSQLGMLEVQLEQLQRARDAYERAESTPRWDRLLQVIARESAGRAQLKSIQIASGSDGQSSWSVSIHGSTSDAQSPNVLVARLEATGLFSNVRRRSAPGLPTGDRTEFFLDCSINP
ncbi:MAG: hypothetical protein ACFCBV_10105 [Phycisphaerales bacterium]